MAVFGILTAYDFPLTLSDWAEIFTTDTWEHSLEVVLTVFKKLVFFLFFETAEVKVLVKNQDLKFQSVLNP